MDRGVSSERTKGTERLENKERERSTPTACSTAQTPSTWTEPPSLSAVRCDPRSSLLVTGVGWDSLPLGSGDWHDSNGGKGGRVAKGIRDVFERR